MHLPLLEQNPEIDTIVKLHAFCFCCSLWMQTAGVTSGVLVAKVMEGSSLSYYSISLVADSSDYLFQFSFLPEGASTQRSVEVSFPQSALPIGVWHSLSVTVGGGSVRFYSNGVFRGSRYCISRRVLYFSCSLAPRPYLPAFACQKTGRLVLGIFYINLKMIMLLLVIINLCITLPLLIILV